MSTFDKKAVRQHIRAAIAALGNEHKSRASADISAQVAATAELREAHTIALFASLADEPQTTALIEQAQRDGKRVVVPRIEGDNMEFYDIAEGLCEGAYGIMEPTAAMPVDASEIDVMVVPGVAFTRQGARLGRGKGFYDRYLSRQGFRAFTIGICYRCQVVDTLPIEPHDKTCHTIISE